MSENFKKFLKQGSIVSAILLAFVVVSQFLIPKFYLPAHYITVALGWLVTIGVFVLAQNSIKNKAPGAFVNIFMAASIAKMFLFLVYIIIYVFTIKINNIQFLVFVLINYSVFTVFEIYVLLKQQKSKTE
ncbi:MAG: hypothetical protein JXL97_10785 [Bacteroidales bacterium]|nr:hypothetical protein [Bacteroidales bacterium]